MNRREWLVRVFGTTVAAAVAPLVDLGDATPAFWNQAPIRNLMRWRLTFPDGEILSFAASVVSETLNDDGTVQLKIRSDGPITFEQWHRPRHAQDIPVSPEPTVACDAGRGQMQLISVAYDARILEGSPLAIEPIDIESFSVRDLSRIADKELGLSGLARRGSVTIHFKPEVL